MKSIKKDLSELRENFSKLEAELAVTKQVSNVLCNQMIQVERIYRSNEQYSGLECLEKVRIPETVADSTLEETALNTFKELDFSVQACVLSDSILIMLTLYMKKLIIHLFTMKQNVSKRAHAYQLQEE